MVYKIFNVTKAKNFVAEVVFIIEKATRDKSNGYSGFVTSQQFGVTTLHF